MGKDIATRFDPASSLLERFRFLIPRDGRVLEIACGNGRNTRYLNRFCPNGVTAVDINPMPVVPEGVRFVRADLEGAPWPFAGEVFDLVVVINYLHRPLFSDLFRSVSPGGCLIYETFTEGQKLVGVGPKSEDHLLRAGELLQHVPAGWAVVSYEDGVTDFPSYVQRLVVRNVPPDAPLQDRFTPIGILY